MSLAKNKISHDHKGEWENPPTFWPLQSILLFPPPPLPPPPNVIKLEVVQKMDFLPPSYPPPPPTFPSTVAPPGRTINQGPKVPPPSPPPLCSPTISMKWVPLLPADYKSWTDGKEGKEVLINYYYIEDPTPGKKAAVLFLPKNRVEKGRRGRNP